MRHLSNRKQLVGAAVPAALAGSIALLLSGPAAGATERQAEPQPARMPLLGVTGVVVPQRAPASVAVPDTYTVARGDTVFGIAVRYGLRTADILAINGLSGESIIRPGQVLRLTGTAPSTQAVAPPAPAAASGTYAVAPGDTLSAIAERHGITVQELFAANGLGRASIIYPGQTLRIGGGPAPSPAAPAAPAPPAAPPAPVAGSGHVHGAGR